MSYYDKVFWAVFVFLLGVVSASLAAKNSINLVTIYFGVSLLTSVLIVIKFPRTLIIITIFSLGMGYYYFDDLQYQKRLTAPLSENIKMTGIISAIDDKYEYQRVTLNLQEEFSGRVIFNVTEYSPLTYGDRIQLEGELSEITGEAKYFFQKERVNASVKKVKNLEVVEKRKGSKIKTILFDFREYIQRAITRVLPEPHSNFVTGLLIGKSGGFSKEFLEQLRTTGTTHLIALSGYNVTIIATYILEIMILFCSRRKAVYAAGAGIMLFVIMTGAQASVVRAAVMAGIVLCASQTSRVYKPRNAICLAAFFMTLANPKVLVFDVGFQLSFLALLGIIYIKPAVEKHAHLSREPGFFSWRENLLTTTVAQIAVLPVILYVFGFFSLIALVTNVLILTLTPYTMLYGGVIVLASSLSTYLAIIVATILRPLVQYQVWVIQFFSQHAIGITIDHLPLFILVIYYLAVGYYLYLVNKKYGNPQTV